LHISPRFRGLVCSVLSSVCFSAMTAFVHQAGDLPSMQKILFRNLVALLLAGGMLLRRRTSLRVARGSRLDLLGRCAAGTLGLACNFYAIDRMVLADANMLNKLSPFFAVLFSYFLLRERLRPAHLLGVAAAFGGALLIIRPTLGLTAALPALSGLVSGMGAGLAYTFVRRLGQRGEDPNRIIFYFSLFSCAVSLPPFFLLGRPMTSGQLLWLLAAGAGGAGGQFFITRAYFYAPARELSVYEYLQVLFAAAWGFVLFGQVPDLLSFLGYGIIVGTAAVMFLYNTRSGPFRPKRVPEQ
jgi:drug/metabolite transporter (DMT)-like permease